MKNVMVILNYNDYNTTSDYLELIGNYKCLDYIIVVDNNSTDNSYQKLLKYNNKKIKVIIVADEKRICKDNDEYKDFKEKVIQSTLQIDSNYREIINNVVKSYNEMVEGYNGFILKNIDNLYQVFEESTYSNLRTLKSILIGF